MKTGLVWLALLTACVGCSTAPRSEVAASMGFAKDSKVVEAGPYTVHYGSDGDQDLLVVMKGDETLYTKRQTAITVYAQGRAFLNYAYSGANHAVAAYMVHIRDAEGKDAFTLIDEDVDGTYERKIDYNSKIVYDWKNGQWVIGKKP